MELVRWLVIHPSLCLGIRQDEKMTMQSSIGMTGVKTFSLDRVDAFLRDRVAPQAEAMDHDATLLQQRFAELGARGWLGLRIAQEWGGLALGDREFRQFQELLAQYSGALAFLQAQHQSAGSFLSQSPNRALQAQYLPQLAQGAVAMGVGFSHLRRAGEPLVKATAIAGGYRLTGTIPWITGFGIFSEFIGAAVLPDGQAVYGVLPLATTQVASGTLHLSPPLALAALTATNTVTAELHDWLLPSEQVVFMRPAGAIHDSDRRNVLQHSVYALGTAQAGLAIAAQALPQREFVRSPHAALTQELHQCRTAIYNAEQRSVEAQLQLRAWAIDLAVRCAHAGVVVSAGAANGLSHPAQRVFREAMLFSVTGQTTAVMAATLNQLAQPRSPDSETAAQAISLNLW